MPCRNGRNRKDLIHLKCLESIDVWIGWLGSRYRTEFTFRLVWVKVSVWSFDLFLLYKFLWSRSIFNFHGTPSSETSHSYSIVDVKISYSSLRLWTFIKRNMFGMYDHEKKRIFVETQNNFCFQIFIWLNKQFSNFLTASHVVIAVLRIAMLLLFLWISRLCK